MKIYWAVFDIAAFSVLSIFKLFKMTPPEFRIYPHRTTSPKFGIYTIVFRALSSTCGKCIKKRLSVFRFTLNNIFIVLI